MVTDQEKFEGAIRARSFPIVVDHFLPRAQEFWKQNKWINPPQQVDSHGKYLPPFLQSVVAQKRSKSTSSNSESKTPPVILDLPQAIPKKIPEKKLLHYGVLWKLGQGFLIDPWAQRFFVLDFQQHTLTYYSFHSSLQSLPATTPTSSSSSGLSSSSLSSGDVPNSLSSLLLNDPKKVQKGVINLENKKILFYVNDKYSIHWFNSHEDIGEKAMISSTSATASVPRGTSSSTQTTSSGTSSSTPPTTYTPLSTESNLSSRDSYIIEIIYLKSVPDSKRSNMILLTYNYQIGKEWAQALTYVTALATKYSTKKTVKRSKKAKGKKEDPTELEEDDAEFNELRDEVRDSLASYHGLIPPMGYNPLPPHQL